jgi:hypothetical protein
MRIVPFAMAFLLAKALRVIDPTLWAVFIACNNRAGGPNELKILSYSKAAREG